MQAFSGEESSKILFKATWAIRWPDMTVLDDIYQLYQESNGRFSNYCDHVINTMTIRWNGDLVPCCYDLTGRYLIGNIHEHDLDTLWNNQKFQKLRWSIDKMTFNPLCGNCGVVVPKVFLAIKPEFRAAMRGKR